MASYLIDLSVGLHLYTLGHIHHFLAVLNLVFQRLLEFTDFVSRFDEVHVDVAHVSPSLRLRLRVLVRMLYAVTENN